MKTLLLLVSLATPAKVTVIVAGVPKLQSPSNRDAMASWLRSEFRANTYDQATKVQCQRATQGNEKDSTRRVLDSYDCAACVDRDPTDAEWLAGNRGGRFCGQFHPKQSKYLTQWLAGWATSDVPSVAGFVYAKTPGRQEWAATCDTMQQLTPADARKLGDRVLLVMQ